jgi:hypothetical protein
MMATIGEAGFAMDDDFSWSPMMLAAIAAAGQDRSDHRADRGRLCRNSMENCAAFALGTSIITALGWLVSLFAGKVVA